VAKPFDATLNNLIDARPDDWVRFLAPRAGLAPGAAEVLDTDLSITVQADKVFRIAGAQPALLHLELEANPRLGIPEDLLRYNVLLHHLHRLPVHSVLLLLRPKANASDQTGHYSRVGLSFDYTVVRVWQESAEVFLNSGPTLAPLALLTNDAAQNLAGVFGHLTRRLQESDISASLKEVLVGSTYVLSGLRYDETQIQEFSMSLDTLLDDSTTYQGILRKGEAKGLEQGMASEARRMLLLIGRKRFGAVPESAEAQLKSITDTARVERMAERILDASGWEDLLATQ